MVTDRTLLLNLLSQPLDDAPRELLADALQAWRATGDKPLAETLRERGLLDVAQVHCRGAEDSLVETAHLHDLERTTDHDPRGMIAFEKDDGARMRGSVNSAASRYQIVRPHAKGGLGEVFVALDQELHREVALKEIQPRYADEARARDRFVLEAEITGNLEHPGIVPVYGLGTYPDGRPYYAMRFIQGDNLKDHVARFHAPFQADRVAIEEGEPRDDVKVKQVTIDRHAVGLEGVPFRQLLRRFVDVCNAVAFAHSRGIIHRDLKPANVMLGDFGETLVVDWGLAKRVGALETEGALAQAEGLEALTQDGAIVGTPAYASPEQAAGGQVGPASDTYALGATLFSLLCNQVSVQGKNTQEILRKVQAGEVSWERIARAPLGLQAICRKAMQLKPADRYPSAQDVARDVERWLADEPVSCCTEPVSVRLRRWGRKHRTLVTNSMLGLALAAAFLTVLSVLLNSKNVALAAANVEVTQAKERETAAKERAEGNFTMAKDAVEKYLGAVTQDSDLKRADFNKLRKKLLETAIPFFEKIARQQSADPEVEAARGRAFHRLAYLRDVMGDMPAARREYENMRGIYAALVAAYPSEPAYRDGLASSHNNLGILLDRLGERPAAKEEYREVLRLRGQLVADYPAMPLYRHALAQSHNNFGNLLRMLGESAAAQESFQQTIRIMASLIADFPDKPSYREELAGAYGNLGVLRSTQGDQEGARDAFQRSLHEREKLAAEFSTEPAYQAQLAGGYLNLGILLRRQGEMDAARTLYSQAVLIEEKLVAAFPTVLAYRQHLAMSYANLGNLLRQLKEGPAARAVFLQAIRMEEQIVADFPAVPEYRDGLALSHYNFGNLLRDLQEQSAALAAYQQARHIQEKLVADFPNAPSYAARLGGTYVQTGNVLLESGETRAALEEYQRGISCLGPLASRGTNPAQARFLLREAYRGRAVALGMLGHHAEAAAAWGEGAKLAEANERGVFDESRQHCLFRAATEEVPAWAVLWGWPRF